MIPSVEFLTSFHAHERIKTSATETTLLPFFSLWGPPAVPTPSVNKIISAPIMFSFHSPLCLFASRYTNANLPCSERELRRNAGMLQCPRNNVKYYEHAIASQNTRGLKDDVKIENIVDSMIHNNIAGMCAGDASTWKIVYARIKCSWLRMQK